VVYFFLSQLLAEVFVGIFPISGFLKMEESSELPKVIIKHKLGEQLGSYF